MKQFVLTVMLFFLTAGEYFAHAQYVSDADTLPENVLLEKQWSLGAMVHTNGWGLKFRRGHNVTALRQFMWEIEFSTYKSTKEIRTLTNSLYFPDSRPYIYGKLNYLFFLRGGIGQQHILNRKPYWGGIQLSWLYYGGFSLGLAKPVYLYIIYINSGSTDYEIKEEKYNPELHFVDNIYGRGPFLSGILNLGFYPGAYIKTGLDFEFGTHNRRINSLEVGATLDFSPIPIPIMAYNPKQQFFLTLYLSVMLGKRYNK
ncbi:MAG: hypothetical protein M0Q38_10445 [Bacteroidales bacterium]|jgi:hypothetical protein|nr:hypothetical protein [Bacteroidales bacterium]